MQEAQKGVEDLVIESPQGGPEDCQDLPTSPPDELMEPVRCPSPSTPR